MILLADSVDNVKERMVRLEERMVLWTNGTEQQIRRYASDRGRSFRNEKLQ